MKKRLLPWIGASIVVLLTFATIYAAVQQSQRRAANSPQIELAEDAAAALNSGTPPSYVVGNSVDMNHSLAPFVIVYNKSGKVIAGSGYLHGKIPSVPFGVLTASRNKDYNFVTWQPNDGPRIAAVSVDANRYYVLSGRSMKEVEKNATQTLQIVVMGLIASLLTMLVTFAAITKR